MKYVSNSNRNIKKCLMALIVCLLVMTGVPQGALCNAAEADELSVINENAITSDEDTKEQLEDGSMPFQEKVDTLSPENPVMWVRT